jgi:hypothetical protein
VRLDTIGPPRITKMATTKITNASDSAAAAGKFSQLDLVSREQEQHCESKLAQYFKTFADSRQTSTPGPITTQPKE